MHGQTDRIESPPGETIDILTLNVFVPIEREKLIGIGDANKICHDGLKGSWGICKPGGLQHVPFWNEPAAEAHTPEYDLVVTSVSDVDTGCMQVSLSVPLGREQKRCKECCGDVPEESTEM
jgi:hypothetical protein